MNVKSWIRGHKLATVAAVVFAGSTACFGAMLHEVDGVIENNAAGTALVSKTIQEVRADTKCTPEAKAGSSLVGAACSGDSETVRQFEAAVLPVTLAFPSGGMLASGALFGIGMFMGRKKEDGLNPPAA